MVENNGEMSYRLGVFNAIIGILYILISGAILSNLDVDESTLVIALAINLILMGFAKLINGISNKAFSKVWISLNIIIAIILIIAGILVIINPSLSIQGLLIIITIGLAIQGIYRVSYGIFNKNISLWATTLNLILGAISIGVSIYVVFNTEIAVRSIIILLCIVFAFNGIIRILSGLRGYINIEDE